MLDEAEIKRSQLEGEIRKMQLTLTSAKEKLSDQGLDSSEVSKLREDLLLLQKSNSEQERLCEELQNKLQESEQKILVESKKCRLAELELKEVKTKYMRLEQDIEQLQSQQNSDRINELEEDNQRLKKELESEKSALLALNLEVDNFKKSLYSANKRYTLSQESLQKTMLALMQNQQQQHQQQPQPEPTPQVTKQEDNKSISSDSEDEEASEKPTQEQSIPDQQDAKQENEQIKQMQAKIEYQEGALEHEKKQRKIAELELKETISKMQRLQQDIDELISKKDEEPSEKIQELESTIQELQDELSVEKSKVYAMNAEIDNFKKTLHSTNKRHTLNQEDLQKRLQLFQQSFQQGDNSEEINKQKEKVKKLKELKEEQETVISQLNQKIEQLEAHNQLQESQIKELQEQSKQQSKKAKEQDNQHSFAKLPSFGIDVGVDCKLIEQDKRSNSQVIRELNETQDQLIKQLQVDQERYESKLCQSELKISQLSNQIVQYEQQLTKYQLRGRDPELEEAVLVLKQEFDSIAIELQQTQEQRNELNEANRQYERQIKQLKMKIEDKECEIKSLQNKLEEQTDNELEQLVEKLKMEVQRKNNQIQFLIKKTNQQSFELSKLAQQQSERQRVSPLQMTFQKESLNINDAEPNTFRDLRRDIEDIKAGQYHLYKKLTTEIKTIQKTVQSISPLSRERTKYSEHDSTFQSTTPLQRNYIQTSTLKSNLGLHKKAVSSNQQQLDRIYQQSILQSKALLEKHAHILENYGGTQRLVTEPTQSNQYEDTRAKNYQSEYGNQRNFDRF